MSLLRYLRTIRYLRPVQLYGRVWHRLHRPMPDCRPSPPRRRWQWPLPRGVNRPISLLGPSTFRFLNVEGEVRSAGDWDDPARPALWTYNVHYFDDLSASGAETRTQWHHTLVRRWVAENPPGRGVGWDPYPTSLRIVNWIRWAVRLEESADAVPLHSLAIQARHLARRLEYHLLGNHLWSNGKALVFAGAFFGGDEGERWLARGTEILERELGEQVLADGGHFERSPMYHAIVLADVLDLLALRAAVTLPPLDRLGDRLQRVVPSMFRWLRVMTHPDGRIAQFNDATLEGAPSLDDLREYATRLACAPPDHPLEPIELLAESGYARLQNAQAVVICDVAPIGPDYLPGHAHADTLSFEASLGGRRVVVDTGTSTYAPGERRERERGTVAHNTVVVNDTDSSEVWGSFRVARRARVHGVRTGREGSALWLEGEHDGYRTAGVVHRRRWTLTERALVIEDSLSGTPRSAVALLHLHPVAEVETLTEDGCRLRVPGAESLAIAFHPGTPVSIREGYWSPDFGRREPAAIIAASFGRELTTTLRWS